MVAKVVPAAKLDVPRVRNELRQLAPCVDGVERVVAAVQYERRRRVAARPGLRG